MCCAQVGFVFFSGPNRLAVLEEHYWLPFLSWLPQPLADLYVRLSRRGRKYDVWPMTYWQLRCLWSRFHLVDYTPSLLHEPKRFGVDDELGRFRFVSRLPLWVWRAVAPLLPNFNWILIKRL